MSTEEASLGRAEKAFREAFYRLKRGKPKNVKMGSPVTQNNVAREAGRDPSALKKARFPLLVEQIQAYVDSQGSSSPATSTHLAAARRNNRKLAAEKQELKVQRDDMISKILSLQIELLSLYKEVETLRGKHHGSVVQMQGLKR